MVCDGAALGGVTVAFAVFGVAEACAAGAGAAAAAAGAGAVAPPPAGAGAGALTAGAVGEAVEDGGAAGVAGVP